MSRPRHSDPAHTATHFQPHIQGLRAIAVLLVVLYHVWPGRLSGGYVGVDVFFVISGFLITGQLVRELYGTGRVNLPSFWAKRARRLLPASITVLIFSGLATLFILPLSSLVVSVKEILASTFYFQNWQLALGSVNYLAAHDATVVQHYWTLSLEEQFYVFWPLLLLAGTWLAARYFARSRWFSLAVVVGVVSLLSLVACVFYTQANPAAAYFVTFTRVWEFGVGAVLALLPRFRPQGAWWPNLIGYAGIAAILYAGYFFDADTQFPGWMALVPVLGSAAVIVSARSTNWWDVGRVLSGRPQRFLGDISYSLYLWHWPLIIIAPYIPGWGLDGWNRIVLIAVCILLAWLTKILIEDPARTWKFLTVRRPRVTAQYSLAIMAVSALLVGAAFVVNNPKYEAAAAELSQIGENPPECFGAVAGPDCVNPELADAIIPSPGFGNADTPGHEECFVQLNESEVKSCSFGSTAAGAPRVALIGDSHAYQFIDAMIKLADANGWALTTYLKGACPWTTTQIGGPSVAFIDSCATWRANLKTELAGQPAYDAIFAAALADTPFLTDAPEKPKAIAAGFAEAWQQAKGAPIVTIVDNPDFSTDPNKCLRISPAADCVESREDVLKDVDPIGIAARDAGATLLDLTDKYCDATHCFSVVGGANVYRDQDHLTNTWALSMAEMIGEALTAAIQR